MSTTLTAQPEQGIDGGKPAGTSGSARVSAPIRAADAAPFALASLLFLAVGARALQYWFVQYTLPNSYYAHAPLIPLMAAWMLWTQRAQLAATVKRPFLPALVVLIPALVLLVVAAKISAFAMLSVSLLAAFWSALWLLLGGAFMRVAAFPFAFLALMMPFPGPVLNDLTRGLQQMSTNGAAALLNLITFHNTLSGYRIAMDNYTLFVDVPCSGFKTLLALMTFNAFFARMLDGSVSRRGLIFLTCLPLALAINVVRISLIGIVGESISDSAAHVFHDYSGLITLLLGFGVLFAIARMFGCRKFAGLAIF